MKVLIPLLLMLLTPIWSLYALDVDIEVSPQSPIVDESFEVNFNIEMDGREDPMIRFNPGSAEVLRKINKGVSINTTVVNGQISTVRKVTIGYQMVAKKVGFLYLREISVEADGERKDLKNLRINVLKEAKEPQSMFLRAETPKEEYYVGEGVDLKYYIYYRNNIVAQEIKEFPKLNGFIKRFHKEINNTERVEVDGVLYRRTLVYSARLYPEKIGEATIDPLRINLQYSDFAQQSPFGTFGLQLGRYKDRTFSSKSLKLKIIPIPAENAPANFTGLVGDHTFEFTQAETRFLVNQAIEYRLVVQGDGALEKYDAPIIYNHADLEQFDTRSEVVEVDKKKARKQFDYTLLPRGAMNIEKSTIELSTFDPETREFVNHQIELPGLVIGGGGAPVATSQGGAKDYQNDQARPSVPVAVKKEIEPEIGFVAPTFKPIGIIGLALWPRLLLYISSVMAVIIFIIFVMKLYQQLNPVDELKMMMKRVEREGLSYRGINSLIRRVFPELSSGASLSEVLENVEVLSSEEKRFLRECIKQSESNDYGNRDRKNKKSDSAATKKLIGLMSKVIKSAQV